MAPTTAHDSKNDNDGTTHKQNSHVWGANKQQRDITAALKTLMVAQPISTKA
jgi:hypothetical protein